MIKYIYGLLLVFVFCQCQNVDTKQSYKDYDEIISINIDDFNKENHKASVIVDSIEYVRLESPENIIIGAIDKLECVDHKFYILDKISNAFFVFNDNGEFLFKVGNQGKGPREYISLGSFAIDYKDKNIYLYDNHAFKFIRYDSLGKYISCKTTEYLVSDFSINNSCEAISTRFPIRDNFKEQVIFNRFIVPDTKNIRGESLKGIYSSLLDRFTETSFKFSEYSGHINYLDSYSSSVYQLGDSCNVEKQILIDFGKYKIHNIYDMTDQERDDYRKRFNKEKKASLVRINETSKWWIISYGFDNLINVSFYSKLSKKLLNLRGFWINDKDKFSLPFPITAQGEYLISKIDVFTFKTLMENKNVVRPQHLIDLDKRLKSTDNPILMKIKLKDNFDFKN